MYDSFIQHLNPKLPEVEITLITSTFVVEKIGISISVEDRKKSCGQFCNKRGLKNN